MAIALLAAAVLAVTAEPSHAWGGGRVFIGVGPYWGPPYPYPYPYWGPYYDPYAAAREEQERKAMAEVFLTTEPALVSGCTQIGVSGDDNVKDLRRKIVRGGGNAAVLTFRVDDLKMMAAEVYKCPTAAAKAQPSPTPPPARSPSNGAPPPPPAGTPPPPPPSAR